jgi:Kef-type K+ transport system membrane component KefB
VSDTREKETSQTAPAQKRPVWIAYTLMIVATIGLFVLIRWYGETLSPQAAPDDSPARGLLPPSHSSAALFHVLLALLAIVVLGRVLGRLLAYVGQPRVMGEVIAGILLGPSLLGRVSPQAMAFVLPAEVAPYLAVIAQLGVILYMFLVGLALNAELLRSRARASVAISHASIVVPFVLGAALALGLYPRLAPAGVPFTSFALFMGVAMAITAFPVLARILTDLGIENTILGVLALTCAAAGDVTAWCLLACVVAVVRAELGGALATAFLALGFITLILAVVRPVAARFLAQRPEHELTSSAVAAVFVALLLSALTTEAIGIHAIFGAFLLGAVIPHDSAAARLFRAKLEDIVTILLLPAFFAYTGMRTQIGLVSGLADWLIVLSIILVATAGKFGGCFVAARLTGLDVRTSAALGILMNTRGLMELIVLNIGLELGVISPALFAMMVLMALVTTLATAPLLRLCHQPRAILQVFHHPADPENSSNSASEESPARA